jgi:NADPH:quinone reductase
MDACRELGADLVLERSPADWAAELRRPYPVVSTSCSTSSAGEEVNRNLAVGAPAGHDRPGRPDGRRADPVNLGLLLVKRVHWIGTTLRARPIEQKVALAQRFVAEVLPLFDDGTLRPVIDTRFALDDIADAHRHMEADANVGKILDRRVAVIRQAQRGNPHRMYQTPSPPLW